MERLMEMLPFKPGSTLYAVVSYRYKDGKIEYGNFIEPTLFPEIGFREDGVILYTEHTEEYKLEDLGTYLFLTRDEAEAALTKRNKTV